MIKLSFAKGTYKLLEGKTRQTKNKTRRHNNLNCIIENQLINKMTARHITVYKSYILKRLEVKNKKTCD